jgi:hypothetical protein
MWDKG